MRCDYSNNGCSAMFHLGNVVLHLKIATDLSSNVASQVELKFCLQLCNYSFSTSYLLLV